MQTSHTHQLLASIDNTLKGSYIFGDKRALRESRTIGHKDADSSGHDQRQRIGNKQPRDHGAWCKLFSTTGKGRLSSHLRADCRVSDYGCLTARASWFMIAFTLWPTCGLTHSMTTVQHHWIVQQLVACCALKAVWCPGCTGRDLHIGCMSMRHHC